MCQNKGSFHREGGATSEAGTHDEENPVLTFPPHIIITLYAERFDANCFFKATLTRLIQTECDRRTDKAFPIYIRGFL